MTTNPRMPPRLAVGFVPRVVRTLLTGGYTIDACDRPAPGAVVMRIRKREALGGEARTVVLFTRTAGRALISRLTRDAVDYRGASTAVALGNPLRLPPEVRQFTASAFFSLLGGEIRTDRIFNPKLSAIMQALGHRRVPEPLQGKAETLLEGYSQDGFSYLLESSVRRFGQDRAFEKLPDALVLARDRFNVCLDAKAYRGGYHPTAADMRAFADYIREFNGRYSEFVGPIAMFVVISGSFYRSQKALANRANELLSAVATPLVFMRAKDLAAAINLLRPHGHRRGALDWRKILVPPLFDLGRLKAELHRVMRDGVI